MGVDDLRERQKKATAVLSLSHEINRQFAGALLSVKSQVESKTGLALKTSTPERVPCSSREAELVIGETSFSLWVDHIPGEAVMVSTWTCAIHQQPNGMWQTHVKDHYTDLLRLRTVLAKPSLPLSIQPAHGPSFTMWWCGPEDNDKLAAALVDAVANRERPSEFSLVRVEDPNALKAKNEGCVFLVASLVVTLIAVLLLNYY
jgi:hypothetical protein